MMTAMDKAAREKARERLANDGLNDANGNHGIRVGSDLHLCEMLLADLDAADSDNARLRARIGELEGENEELLQVDRDIHAELDKIGLSKGSGGEDGEYNAFGRIADLLIPQLTLLQARVSELEAALTNEREECAKVAERDVNWAQFGMAQAVGSNPDIFEHEPSERNITIYRSSICAGRSIAGAIRSRVPRTASRR